jgi:hypothetical protein
MFSLKNREQGSEQEEREGDGNSTLQQLDLS